MESIVVTGGAGFIGSHICCDLARDNPGARIIAVDNLRRRGSELNLKKLAAAGAEFIHGDVRNLEDWPSLRQGRTLVVDCAAEPSVSAGTGGDPRYVIATNLVGTIQALEFARNHRADFIFLSTSRVYPIAHLQTLPLLTDGARFDLPKDFESAGLSFQGIAEDFPLDGVRSLYGATKLAGELLIAEYVQAYQMRAVVNRCGVVTGPGQMGKVDQGVFSRWIAAHYFGRPLGYFGHGGMGHQVRDFLHVTDLTELISWQIAHIGDVSGRTFNVGGGRDRSLSLAELTGLAARLAGRETRIDSVESESPNDVRWYISDPRHAIDACHWSPRRSLEVIAEDVLRWLHDERTVLSPYFE